MRSLTARGVRAILTRSGVDHSLLTISQSVVRSRRIDGDYVGPWQYVHEVIVEGPKDVRREAASALYDRGLTNAPYPDHDEWSRR